jgi:hypothetical protein
MSELQTAATANSPNIFVQQNTTQTITYGPNSTVANTTKTPTGSLFLGNTSVTPAGRTKGGWGLCQDVVVPANGSLTFSAAEGTGGTTTGTTANFVVPSTPAPAGTTGTFAPGSAQEAAILTPSSLTLLSQLFVELDGAKSTPTNNPLSNTVPGNYTGFVQKGPYDLSAYAGQTVTLYFGIWSSSAATTSFTFMYIDDVRLVNANLPASSTRRQPATTRKH